MDEMVYSAAVLSRVAEAADGFRDGKKRWFILDAVTPHKVDWATTHKEAVDKLEHVRRHAAPGENWIVFGPCKTKPDKLRKPTHKWIECKVTVAELDAKGEVALDSSGKPKTRVRKWTNDEDKPGMDALFFTLSSMDKFLFPYYTAVYGPQVAADMRRRFLDKTEGQADESERTGGPGDPPCIPLCHDPKSDECECDEGGVTALLIAALTESNRLF